MLLVMNVGAWAQEAVIHQINIHGNRRIPAETIRARIFTRPGDVLDVNALERDFMSLWNTGYFDDIRFERADTAKGVDIEVYVHEKPTIRDIKYIGLNSATQSEVLDRYKERKVSLTKESQYDPTRVKRAEVTLKELLAEKGRQFATIRSEVRQIPPAGVELTFVIKEGPKVKVGKIKFEGNKQLSKGYLRNAMRWSKPIGIPKSIVLENIFARTYDSTKLSEDVERVRFAAQRKGYFKVLVQDPKTQIRDVHKTFYIPLFQKKNGKVVDITVPIEEGERYRLKEIKFTNNKALSDARRLRTLFNLKDGDVLDVDEVRKGLDNLRKAYGEFGYINFTSVPDFRIDDEKKEITIVVDCDEGKPFYVRRVEFQGNTTTRDKVIRRELAVEEGNVYNSRLWELSLLRLNQLQYFEPLKVEQDSEVKQNTADGTVDITLKVKEKGKNSIGLSGGFSGLAGSFIGINYSTNNFLGMGETLSVEASVGSRERNLMFGFTEPYLFDRPLQFGFTVFTRKYDYNEAEQTQILTNQRLGDLPESVRNTLQNYTQSSTGFTVSGSYAMHRSFKRLGLTYAYDSSTIKTYSTASQQLFELLAFRGLSGPNALEGIVTSKIIPSFSWSTVDYPQRAHSGKSIFAAVDFSGLGGSVRSVRPVVEFKHFIPFRYLKPTPKDPTAGRQTLGYRIQATFLSGWGGLVAPPQERFYLGGENDIRGFDLRSLTPYAFLTQRVDVPLVNPTVGCLTGFGCTPVPKDPSNPRRGSYTIPLAVPSLVSPGGDASLIGNLEYRIPLAGPVSLAAFVDVGTTMAVRNSQLKLSTTQLSELTGVKFGCPGLDTGFNCIGGINVPIQSELIVAQNTNYVPRMSTGLEIQAQLPVINAPVRIYYAYNPLRLDTFITSPSVITRDMFPAGGAGDFTFKNALSQFGTAYRLREPRKTFRFTVSTSF